MSEVILEDKAFKYDTAWADEMLLDMNDGFYGTTILVFMIFFSQILF